MAAIPSPSILDALSDDEQQRLAELSFDVPSFDELADLLGRGQLPSNIVEGELTPAPDNLLPRLPNPTSGTARALRASGEQLLRQGKAGLVLLNGGMATRFGGRVKGTVEALPGRSFLALQAARLADLGRGASNAPPLLLMNSEATDEPTRAHLEQGDHFGLEAGDVFCFRQSGAPRLRPDGQLFRNAKGDISIYGPGHGDLIPAMQRSGALAWLRERGVQFLLMANVDNLGAGLDPLLLGHFASSADDMMVELVDRSPGERGGAPCAVDGRVQIVEDFAFPDGFDPQTIPCFNTNTLWLRSEALSPDFPLRWYAVSKETEGQPVVQFERLVGQLSWFLSTGWMRVSRERFLPVKTPQDLRDKQAAIRALFG
jgi:UTP--glucose-1-phosphate uridylyltransferase